MDGSKTSIAQGAKGQYKLPGPCSFASGDSHANATVARLSSGPSSLFRLKPSITGNIYQRTFDFCLGTSTHFWTTSADEVAWPQGDLFLGEGL